MNCRFDLGPLPEGDGGPPASTHQHDCEHLVQFYDDDAFLVRSVADYIGVALRGGEGAVLIATPAHRDAIEQRLNAAQISVGMAQSRGQYIAVDAAETLSKFMVCGSPDESLFRGNVVPL